MVNLQKDLLQLQTAYTQSFFLQHTNISFYQFSYFVGKQPTSKVRKLKNRSV